MNYLYYQGTNSEQDARFYNKQKKLLKTMKFPSNIGTKVPTNALYIQCCCILVACVQVDMSKVNLDTIKPWITTRVNQLLGIDDDVVVEFVFNLLENTQHPDPKEMQMNLTGFLNGKNARIFMQELWDLLTSAQENIGGIPSIFLEQKKEEIRQKKVGLFFLLFVENCEGSVSISMCMLGVIYFSVHCFYCCLVFQDPSEYWVRHSMAALPH